MAKWLPAPKQPRLKPTDMTITDAMHGWQADVTLLLYQGRTGVYRGTVNDGKSINVTRLKDGLTDQMSVSMLPMQVANGRVIVIDECSHCGAEAMAHHNENEGAFSCSIAENYLADMAENNLPA